MVIWQFETRGYHLWKCDQGLDRKWPAKVNSRMANDTLSARGPDRIVGKPVGKIKQKNI